MPDEPESLVLVYLGRLDEKVDRLSDDRMDRIEKLLDLTEARH